MRVARVVVEAPVTSFRHPLFVTGRQPSFDIPPPSTVFGHCASALGRWPDPETFFFGIHFTFQAKARDLEHQHITTAAPAKTRTRIRTTSGEQRVTTEVTVTPVSRDFLFDARMTLYLPLEFGAAFRAPVFPVVLGRSQDLAEVRQVSEVELERPRRARIAHTLLPQFVRPCVRFGPTVLLTRFISPPPQRETSFAQYIVLHDTVDYGEGAERNRAFLPVPGVALDDLWCDPQAVDDDGRTRAFWLHRIID